MSVIYCETCHEPIDRVDGSCGCQQNKPATSAEPPAYEWYCFWCAKVVEPEHVTFEERHDVCGNNVESREVQSSPVDLQHEAEKWWSQHQDDFISLIAGTGLATHSLYDVPAALAAFAAHLRGK